MTANDPNCVNRVNAIVEPLAGGVPHKFKVRGVNTVGNGAESPESDAIAPNGTTTLAAVNIAPTLATLELSGYSGAWWYKGDQSGASCISVSANTATVRLSGLTPYSTYTYRAYVYPNCTVGLEVASATFSTADALPITFGNATIADQQYLQNSLIDPVTLPVASGGYGGFEYSLTPPLPQGLDFDPVARILSGTPGVASSRAEYTYTATDDSSDTAQLTFAITVEADLAPSFAGVSIADMFFSKAKASLTLPFLQLPAAMGHCNTH